MIRVLIVDDEPLIRAGIRTVLESAEEIEVVAEAETGTAVVEQARSWRADVAVIDIKMPGLDGLGALESLRRSGAATKVLMLTSYGSEPHVMRALENGACGFLLKNCTPDELIRAVRAAHEGDAYLSPAVTRMLLGLVNPTNRRADAADRLAALSDRESDVLRLIAQGMSNADIGRSLFMSETTIKTYVSRILAKLGCSNRVQVALLARDAGLTP
ncbi:DNA-binding NarL/FixJ family response regulator [Allocatelliglobosispora scoriae]|uniref:DNA-binding NarL/FixJ family response regulator n=1 Tax=Allocatelliglobosispora scoriae TaxID=643052 RepID=A0A841C1L0_9ACTN|nr:response regulator transcription factor [Allocatelliglobosispora scoriae]MBB5874244.1 DNA-binding NarL/FixJ family response regulator [Allocatelliglobosispora scoriae]